MPQTQQKSLLPKANKLFFEVGNTLTIPLPESEKPM